MNLALFDLDGTLLQTAEVDEQCFAQAVADVFGIHGISTDWGAYSDSTDAGILDDLLRQHRGRAMTDDDKLAHQGRFVELLDEQARIAPERFAPTPGAAELLGHLRSRGWTCALATGGWRPSARLKLRAARLDVSSLAAAFADDQRSREGIIRTAMRRAVAAAPGSIDGGRQLPLGRAVYVGDGVWDAAAAARLGLGFLGVGKGGRADALRRAGAARVLADFSEPREVLARFDELARPISPSLAQALRSPS